MSFIVLAGGADGDPADVVTLDLTSPALDPRLSFTRASAATDIINGVVTSFSADQPRISTYNGLLIEPQRTNLLPYAATPDTNWGTYSCTKASSADTYLGFNNGTTVTSPYYYGGVTQNTSAVTAGQTCHISIYVKNSTNGKIFVGVGASDIRGTLGSNLSVTYNASGNTYGTITTTPFYGGYIIDIPVIFASAGTPVIRVGPDGSYGTAPISIDVFAAQVETGIGRTSFIPTTSYSATRAADICTGPTAWVNEAEGTIYIEAVPLNMDTSLVASPHVFNLIKSSDSSGYRIRRLASGDTAQGLIDVAGVNQATMGVTAWTVGTPAKAALAWKNNDMAFCFAGGTVQTDTSSPDGMPTGIDTFRIGTAYTSSGFWNGYIRSIQCWRLRQTDSQLTGGTA